MCCVCRVTGQEHSVYTGVQVGGAIHTEGKRKLFKQQRERLTVRAAPRVAADFLVIV